MKPGSFLFWNYHPTGSWLLNFAGEEIKRVVGDPVHAAISPDGVHVYESTVWFKDVKVLWFEVPWPHSGVREHLMADWDYIKELDFTLTPEQSQKSTEWAIDQIEEHRPYNFLELLVMPLVWWTRGFWRWLGRVPFSAGFLGNFCSTFALKCLLAGFSPVPLSDEDFAPPSELASSPMLVAPT
jgi:hypothetical protein